MLCNPNGTQGGPGGRERINITFHPSPFSSTGLQDPSSQARSGGLSWISWQPSRCPTLRHIENPTHRTWLRTVDSRIPLCKQPRSRHPPAFSFKSFELRTTHTRHFFNSPARPLHKFRPSPPATQSVPDPTRTTSTSRALRRDSLYPSPRKDPQTASVENYGYAFQESGKNGSRSFRTGCGTRISFTAMGFILRGSTRKPVRSLLLLVPRRIFYQPYAPVHFCRGGARNHYRPRDLCRKKPF